MSTLPTFSFSTTAEEVADALAQEIRGKNVLVTGTSLNGIGFETAKALAKYASLVVITGHNADRLKLAEDAIRKELPSANIRPLLVDLSSLAAVRKAAAELNAYLEPLHVLIHNAAGLVGPFRLTEDNLESQIATNHFGPFLLTKLLAAKMLETDRTLFTPRVIFVSSIGHAMIPGIDFDTFGHPDPQAYQPLNAYTQSKLANVLMAIELSKRAHGKFRAYSLHPGAVYTNIIAQEGIATALQQLGALDLDGQPSHEFLQWKTIPQGASTTLVAAFDPRIEDAAGSYLVDCKVDKEAVSRWCDNPENGEKLWALTEQVVGERFEI